MGEEFERIILPKNWREYLADLAETKHVFRWVFTELSSPESARWLKRGAIALLVATVFQVAGPRMISEVFSGLVERNFSLVAVGLGGFLAFLLVQKLAEHHYSTAREWLLGINWGNLDDRITELFFEKSVGQHLREGSTLSVANIDKGRWKVLELEATLFFEGAPAILALLLSFIFLWILSPVAGVVMTLVLAVHLGWMLFLNQRVVAICTPIDREFRHLNRHRLERWENFERVKTSGQEDEELSFMAGWFTKAIGADRGFWLWFISQCTLRGLVNLLGLALIMSYGAWLVYRGVWHIGLLYPLYSWSIGVADNIWRIGHVEHQLNWNIPAVRSMIEALSIAPDVVEKPSAPAIKRNGPVAVVFEGVSHSYRESAMPIEGNGCKVPPSPLSHVPVLRNISFVIEPGEKVALIGSSGSGKTTLMRLLLRYADPEDGRILINGRDLKEINLRSWMRLAGYIPQHPQVLDGTIAYNLLYGLAPEDKETVTEERPWELMRLLKIDFGERLNAGLQTVVGRHGVKLSGGQAQRLMIGAAVMKDPRFMVIDEATSSLDSTTERAVQDGLAQVLSGDVGALVVAHRLSTVRDLCDKFVVLRPAEEVGEGESQIEAIAGSFSKLYKQSPTFRRLADDQHLVIS